MLFQSPLRKQGVLFGGAKKKRRSDEGEEALFQSLRRQSGVPSYHTDCCRDRDRKKKCPRKKRCLEPILTVSSEAFRSERTPGAAELPENWDWKARSGLEDAQRRQTMVPDTFSSPDTFFLLLFS